MKENSEQKWFESWFDSPYYHLLYDNRNEEEATSFIGELDLVMRELFLPKESPYKILDLACGKGRHSIALHDLGYHVSAVDLSENSIAEASKNTTEGLLFKIADMRNLDFNSEFDAVLNIFTSFGYFDSDEEHNQVIKGAYRALSEGGIFILDYINPNWINALFNASPLQKQIVEKNNVTFELTKKIVTNHLSQNHIIKTIHISDDNNDIQPMQYEERVRLFSENQLCELFLNNQFHIKSILGLEGKKLVNFSAIKEVSERIIFVCTKTSP